MDQTKKKKKRKLQQYIAMAFMMLIGAVCGFVMVGYVDRLGENQPLHETVLTLVGLFLGMYGAIYLHLIVHEAGHLMFGRMSGYRFGSFRIGSFMWIKENGRLKCKRLSLVGTGGQCLMVPPDRADGKTPVFWYNLGGAVVNLMLGVILLIIWLLCPPMPFLSPLLLIVSLVGIVIAMMNGIPLRMGTVDNDGYNAFSLSKDPEAVRAFRIQLKIAEQSARGIRVKDMPQEWFDFPSGEAMKNSMVATCGVFSCNRLMDAGDFDAADERMAHLLSIESGIVGLHRSLLICDRIFIELIGENRSAVIAGYLNEEQKKFMKAMKQFPSVLRTEYALALLHQGDDAAAEQRKRAFEKVAASYPYPCEIEGERELMELARLKAEKVNHGIAV